MPTTSNIIYNKDIIDVLQKKTKPSKIPIWLMRQAGRYLPEYRSIRGNVPQFLDLCYNPELASEITLQPISRFGFDAAILFSDILVIPHSLGVDVKFESGEGPILEKITNSADLRRLKVSTENMQFEKVWETVARVKQRIPKNIGLIGFAGSPWTVATYMLEGCGGKKSNFSISLEIAKKNPVFLEEIIDVLMDQTINYLLGQIDSGAEVIQLFDSWASVLEYDEYKRFVEKPNKILVEKIRKLRPNIPIICFPKDIEYLEEFVDNVKPDGLSVGTQAPMETLQKIQEKVVVQGNLGPEVLAQGSKEMIHDSVTNILNNLSEGRFIFNLGHGILPQTPIENVEYLLSLVRNYDKNSSNFT